MTAMKGVSTMQISRKRRASLCMAISTGMTRIMPWPGRNFRASRAMRLRVYRSSKHWL